MPNLEKVIKALEECTKYNYVCGKCPYKPSCDEPDCSNNLMIDALKLLVAQKEIVHCKDCKYGRICNNPILGKVVDCQNITPHFHNLNWFCADGEYK